MFAFFFIALTKAAEFSQQQSPSSPSDASLSPSDASLSPSDAKLSPSDAKLSSTDTFSHFVYDLSTAQDIWSTPLSKWLKPAWMPRVYDYEYPEDVSYVLVVDSEFRKSIEFLSNPDYELANEYKFMEEGITSHLQFWARRLLICLDYSQKMNYPQAYLQGLKGLARNLVKNARSFPAWLDQAKPGEKALIFAQLIGLLQPASFATVLEFPKAMDAFITQEVDEFDEKMQLIYSVNVGATLIFSHEVMPDDPLNSEAAFLLSAVGATAALDLDHLQSLVAMIPIGFRFSLGTTNSNGNATLLDMIKGEDGQIYGLKYAADAFLERDSWGKPKIAPTMAFCLPLSNLNALLTHLRGTYSHAHEISGLSNVRTKVVSLQWYSGEKVNDPLAMVHKYAMALTKTFPERFLAGIIWHFGISLLGEDAEIFLRMKQFLMEQIAKVSSSVAEVLRRKLKQYQFENDEESADKEGEELFGVLIRALNARID